MSRLFVCAIAVFMVAMTQAPSRAAINWTSLGPEGGSVNAISIDPRDPNTLYAGTMSGSFFTSGNGGRTWTTSSIGNANLIFDPRDPNIIYARPPLNYLGSLLRSTDQGTSWKNIGPPDTSIADFAISSQDPKTMFVAATAGVFKSTDGGESWRPVNSGLPSQVYVQTLAIHPQDQNTLYVGTRAGVFKTTDGGQTWNIVKEGTTRFALAIDPQDGDTIYVEPLNEAISKSIDGGRSWTTSAQRLTTPIFMLVVDPQLPHTIYACCHPDGGVDTGLWRSTDGGDSWVDAGLKGLRSFAIDPQNSATLYAATDAGVFKSTNQGQSWNAINSGMLGTEVYVLAIDPQDPNTVYAAIGDNRQVFKSTDGGMNWIALTGLPAPANYVFAIHPQNSSLIYAAGPYLYESFDGGETWGKFGPAATFSALALAPQNPDVVYAGSWDGRVFKSPDGGQTWITPTQNFAEYESTGFQICSPGVTSLAVDSEDPNKVYARLSDCNDQAEDVRRSSDGGTNWERTWAALGFGPVVADPRQADVMYAGTTDGVAKSIDGGMSWNELKSGLPTPFFVTSLAIDPQTPSILYAAGYKSFYPNRQSGVFKSIDGGASWSEFDEGLTNPEIETLAVTSHGPNTLYLGSRSGLFKILDDTPVLSMDSAKYCVGDTWMLNVANGGTNTPIRLLGTSNSQSWEIQDWRKTDDDGNSAAAGVFPARTEGRHFLRVDINGTLSNVVSFVVSNCRP